MPKAYLIGHITVTNPAEYAEYVQLDTPLIEAAGGQFLVRGGETEVLEGNFKERHVVVEFPDMAAARAFLSVTPGSTMRNSSPPIRATRSTLRRFWRRRCAVSMRTASPAACPCVSLICLK